MYKIYSTEELQEICRELFYDYMATSIKGTHFTNCHIRHIEYIQELNMVEKSIKEEKESLSKFAKDTYFYEVTQKRLKTNVEHKKHLINLNAKYQKQLYTDNGVSRLSHTKINFPLEKKINPLYDNLELEVLFYDDVCTLNGKFKKYNKLKTKKERKEFIRKNTEITHMSLQFKNFSYCTTMIGLYGKVRMGKESLTLVLPSKYSNFNNVTDELIKNLNEYYYKKDKIDKYFKSDLELLKEKIEKSYLANSYKKCYNKNKLTTNIIDEFPEEIEY